MRKLTVKRRVLLEWLLLALLLPLLMLWLAERPGLRHLDGLLRDHLLQLAPLSPSEQVAVIVVDRDSLDVLGPWPWPQAVHAQLLERLALHGPRSVLLDLPLDQPVWPLDDSVPLASVMTQLPVYLVHRALAGTADAGLRLPPPSVMAAAAGIGHARLVPALDGVVRTLYAQEGSPGHALPYVGLLIAGMSPSLLRGSEPVQTADTPTPWLREGPFEFPLVGTSGRYPTLSFVEVLSGQVPSALLRGRDVLIGVGADAGLGDLWPVSAAQPALRLAGVELHATALDALRSGHTLRAVDGPLHLLWVVLPILFGLCGYLRWERHGALGGLLVAVLCGLASAVLLIQHRLWLSPAAPVVGLIVGYLLWSWRRQVLMFSYFRRTLGRLHDSPRADHELPARPAPGVDAIEHYTRALDEAMERLQTLQRLFRQSLRDLPVAVLLCGRDGVIRHANPAARRLLGLHRSRDLQGQHQRFVLPTILAGLRPAGLPPLPDSHWTMGHEGVQYSRANFVFRVRCVPLSLRKHGWAVVLDDLTPEQRIQAERAQWLRFLSHDLRSPQVNILSHVALDERAHPDAPGRADLAAAVRREVERTLALAEGFMDLSQADAGDFSQEDVLVEAAAGDAADQVWAYAQSRGIQVQVQVDEAEAFVRGNAALLVRALVNMLNNAIRHSAGGSAVRICIGTAGAEALLMVCDEGEGMNEAQVRRLLGGEPRMDAAPDPSSRRADTEWGGDAPVRPRGIGLAVVWTVVQRHGGWIDVWSAPGAGSSFLIGLPLVAADEADAPAPDGQGGMRGGTGLPASGA